MNKHLHLYVVLSEEELEIETNSKFVLQKVILSSDKQDILALWDCLPDISIRKLFIKYFKEEFPRFLKMTK